jgi:hypothetical protein
MAYAFSAIADDATANYYNGAGLAFLGSPQFSVNYCGYVPDFVWDRITFVYLGFGYPLKRSALGMDVTWFHIPPLGPHIPEEDPYTSWHVAVETDYSRKILDDLALGMGLKLLYLGNNREFWSDDPELPPGIGSARQGVAATLALDFNSLYIVSDCLWIGAVLHNIGPNLHYTASDTADPLPRLMGIAVAYVPLDNKYIKCTMSGEMTKLLVDILDGGDDTFWENVMSEFRSVWEAVGLEFTLYRLISLRGGYFCDKEGGREGFTFGGGLHANPFSFDVGIDENILDFPTQNRTVSLSYRFD